MINDQVQLIFKLLLALIPHPIQETFGIVSRIVEKLYEKSHCRFLNDDILVRAF